MDLQESKEDYLEAILVITENQHYVRSVDIAKFLHVSKPSVTYATKQLKDLGFIDMDPNGMIRLTETGKKTAQKVWDKHQILGKLFMFLGVNKEQAMIDACKVEHDLSDKTFKAIKNYMKTNKLII